MKVSECVNGKKNKERETVLGGRVSYGMKGEEEVKKIKVSECMNIK